MLLRDKLLLEKLTMKYGKKNIINEISDELIGRARDNAYTRGRRSQGDYFNKELLRRIDKVRFNFECFYNKDGFSYYRERNFPGIIAEFNEMDDLLYVYFKDYKYFDMYGENLFTDKIWDCFDFDIESGEYHIASEEDVADIYLDYKGKYNNKQDAREWASAAKIINSELGINLSTDWHYYYNWNIE